MTNDTRTPNEIERDITDERAEMSGTINDLQKKFSVDTIVNDLGDMIRDQGGEIGRTISHTVGRNPAAVALIGVGLAWLLVGKDRKLAANATERNSGYRPGGRKRSARAEWDDSALPKGRSNDGPFHNEEHSWYRDGQMSQDRYQGRGTQNGVQASSNGHGGSDGATGTIRRATGAVGDAVSHAAGSLGQTASDLTARLSEGLDDFSEEAKSRVLSARHAAHEARLSSAAALDRGSRAASNLFEDQPLVVGALAVALGAAIGSALPHSKIEDDAMGDSSDRLFAEAQAVYREERDKVMAAAKTAVAEAKNEVSDAGSDLAELLPEGKTAGDVIADRASDAAARVLDRAKGAAEQQGTGRRES
jgi:uncharacterized protein YjbJ (UPF0337 family)